MNRLEGLFERGRKALIAYLCVGDPSVDESIELALACARAGADAVELGVPFSDPTADGPSIARASQRAIARGGGLEATLRAARAIRDADANVGLVLFGYYNPLLVRGEERAIGDMAAAGVDAVLVVDLPVEEGATLRHAAMAQGVGIVPLLAPTSRLERIEATRRTAARGAVPFVYYVSVTGVTGTSSLDAREAGSRAGELRTQLGLPVVVGFGIDSREKAFAAARQADGIAVGTALVRAIEQGQSREERHKAVQRLIRELRAGVDEARKA